MRILQGCRTEEQLNTYIYIYIDGGGRGGGELAHVITDV